MDTLSTLVNSVEQEFEKRNFVFSLLTWVSDLVTLEWGNSRLRSKMEYHTARGPRRRARRGRRTRNSLSEHSSV
jgi:hypothetical protein